MRAWHFRALALVTFVVHDFWTVGWADGPPALAFVLPAQGGQPYPQQRVATFPANFDNEFVHFFKNVGMMGGLAVSLAYSD